MIDPSKIFEAVQAAHDIGASATSTMSKPFMDKVQTRDIGSGDNASQITDGVNQACQQMLGLMGGVKESVLNQLAVIQDKQRREKTYDFQPAMDDLRPTDAQGWPQELGDEFFKPFFGK
ncbi:DUF6277 family protein [Variovorax sp.]|uniref:DUF6277 family protein n=1 Tax=Variovorax sp. TaxID=1871043 RepID=UPI002D2C4884|nr:DUF6277 family protein [Variovorax sp.]HYP86478.1 DUF6277 family protein [Variovorax sp.]